MLITKRFVFVHRPKTGGTFVRQAIDEIARAELAEKPLGPLRKWGLLPRRFSYKETSEYHDTCRDIPADCCRKKIVSVVRNPFDFYVSFYHFGWWITHPEDSYLDLDLVKREFPSFPDLSFAQFLELANEYFVDFDRMGDNVRPHRVGYQTTQFLLHFFKAPAEAYWRIDSDYISGKMWRDDMYPVSFMRTESLNGDLQDLLASEGYPSRLQSAIARKEPVRPAEQFRERPNTHFKSYYTPATYNLVLQKERLLFAMFPEFAGHQTYAEWAGREV